MNNSKLENKTYLKIASFRNLESARYSMKISFRSIWEIKLIRLIFITLITHYSLLITKTAVYAQGEGTGLGTLKGLPGGYAPELTPEMTGEEGAEAAASSLTKIFTNTFGVMTIAGGLMFIMYFVIGGISWITSSGEREKVEKAKKQMTNAVIGLIIVVASYGIAFIVGTVLGVEILDPAKYIIENLKPGAE